MLIITRGFPEDLSSGLHLRVHHLCRELARDHELYLIDFSDSEPGAEAMSASPFESRERLPPPPLAPGSILRHLRLSNAAHLRRAHPRYYRETVARAQSLAARWKVDCTVSFAPGLGGIAKRLDLPRLVDMPDSYTLSLERMLAHRGDDMPPARRLARRVGLWRTRAAEREMVKSYDATLSISAADRRRLLEISGVAPERVVLLPNGVSDEALAAWRDQPSGQRRIVFWGNLDFPPNWTAVRFFHEQIFLPYLADRDVQWHIVGRNAGPDIQSLASHPLIHLVGFQEHIFEYAADAGVMINPMVEGSGLKNKVLEAFALGLPVVTTRLGVDAFPDKVGARCLVADEPEAFATAVLQLLEDPALASRIRRAARAAVQRDYTWAHVGRRFRDVVVRVMRKHVSTGTTKATV